MGVWTVATTKKASQRLSPTHTAGVSGIGPPKATICLSTQNSRTVPMTSSPLLYQGW